MLERLQQFHEDLVKSLQSLTKRIEEIVDNFFNGLTFIERAYQWVVETTQKVWNYLVRFFKALGLLFFASFKLSLFYVPSVILVFVSYYRNENIWWILASLWFFSSQGSD